MTLAFLFLKSGLGGRFILPLLSNSTSSSIATIKFNFENNN
jgi:hypothetical protein